MAVRQASMQVLKLAYLARPVRPALARLWAVPVMFLALCLKLFKALIAYGLILRSIVFQLVQPIRFKRNHHANL